MAKPGQNGSKVKSKGGGFLTGTGCAYMAEPVPGTGVSKVGGVRLSEPRCAYMAEPGH